MRILIAHASRHGSTREIAEHLAERFREDGLLVDCIPAGEAPAVAGYDAVIIGSAIHDQAWLPEAANLVITHAAELRTMPVWLFSVGMPGALARPLRKAAMREGPKALAPYEAAVRPRDTHLFSGVVRKEHFPAGSRAVMRMMGGRYGDFRDWPEIDAWAETISSGLVRPVHGATAPH